MRIPLLALLLLLTICTATSARAQTDEEYDYLQSAFEEAKLAFMAAQHTRILELYDTVSALLPDATPSLELCIMAHQSCEALLEADPTREDLETKAKEIYYVAVAGNGPLVVDEYLHDPRVVEDGYIFPELDEEPIYVAGENALYDLLINEINYPDSSREAGVEGTVIVLFIINKDGSASGFYVDRGLSEELDAEALRVASMAKEWVPGQYQGAPAYSYVGLPITFVLDQ